MARARQAPARPGRHPRRRARQRPLRGARALGRGDRRPASAEPVRASPDRGCTATPPGLRPPGRAAPPRASTPPRSWPSPARAPAVPAEPQPSAGAGRSDGITVIDLTWVYAGPVRDAAARLLRGHGHPRRVARRVPTRCGAPGIPGARRRRPRGEPAVALHQRRQAEPAAQPDGARVPPGGARPRPPGRRRRRGVLARGARAVRPRTRRPHGGQPPPHRRCRRTPVRPQRPAVAHPRLRQHGRGDGRLLRADRLARPPPRRAVPRLHRRHLAPAHRRADAGRARLAGPHRRGPEPRLLPGRGRHPLPHRGRPRPGGQRLPAVHASATPTGGWRPTGVYPCGEPGADDWVAIACETDDQWRTLAGARSAAPTSPTSRPRSGWPAGRSSTGSSRRGRPAGIPSSSRPSCRPPACPPTTCRTAPSVVADPQLLHRDHFDQVPHPVYGAQLGRAVRLPPVPQRRQPRRAGPTWGEHNYEILSDLLGYDGDRIAELAIAGVLE